MENFAVNLSTSFQFDARESWVEQHNRESRDVWEAFNSDRPIRVPVIFSGARTLFLSECGADYRAYYESPEEMLRLQLEWKRRERELPLGDHILGEAPKEWTVSVDFHPVASASCFGCPVVFRPDAVPAHECLHLSREQCREMPMPDVLRSGLLPRHREFSEGFDRLCEGLSFLGRPVRRARPVLPSTGGGVFSSALDIRGPDFMADMYDDPDFAGWFLERIAEWQIDLRRAWHRLDGMSYWMDIPGDNGAIDITDHGIDMLSPELYDRFIAALILKLAGKYGKRSGTFLHHCGRGAHLFPLIQKRFGLTAIHALTWPLNDVSRVRDEIGRDVRITAVISDSILCASPEKIKAAVRDFLTPELKKGGRLSLWVPGEVFGIPVENYQALYDAVREYGRY